MALRVFVATHAIENRYEPAKGEGAMARFLTNAMVIDQPYGPAEARPRHLKSRPGPTR